MHKNPLIAIGMIASLSFAGIVFPAYAGGRKLTLRASWYGKQFNGHKMANGQRFHASDPTIAAHKTLPLGTVLRVTNRHTGRSIHVVVKDRGPYVAGRSLDVSRAAAVALGFADNGVATLDAQVVRYGRG